MAFNAGGTNVGGVQNIEAGEFKISEVSSAATGTGTFNTEFTVPAGKVWIIKSVGNTAGNLVATRTYNSFSIYDGAKTAGLTSTTGADISYIVPTTITLQAGMKVRNTIILSAYTSGQMLVRLGYQEVTV